MSSSNKLAVLKKRLSTKIADAGSFLDTPQNEITDMEYHIEELDFRLQCIEDQLKVLQDESGKAEKEGQMKGKLQGELDAIFDFICETQEFVSKMKSCMKKYSIKISKEAIPTETNIERDSNVELLKVEMQKMHMKHEQEMEKIRLETEDKRQRNEQEMEKIRLDHEKIRLDHENKRQTIDLEMKQEMEKIRLENENLRLTNDQEMKKMKLELELKNESSKKDSMDSNIKLPKLDFNKFTGNILEWKEFWDSFESAIHSNTKLRNVDKLNYLRSKLDGSAKAVISGLELTNENYQVALKLLEKRFGNKRKMINARYEAILQLPKASQDKELRRMFDTLETHLRALEALGENTENNLMILIIWLKLPTNTKVNLEEKIGEDNWTMEVVRKQLNLYINARTLVIDNSVINVHDTTEDVPFTAGALLATVRNPTVMKKKCIYCKDEHWSDQCTKYCTIEDRKAVIKGHCYRCFNRSHTSTTCTIEKECVYCRRMNSHHRSLCPSKFPMQEHVTLATDCNTNTIGTPQLLASGETVLMQTAMVVASGKRTSQKVRILLDSGSQRSYVTVNVSQKLDLIKEKEKTLSVFTFGTEKAEKVRTATVSLDITKKDGTKYPVQLDVVPQITGKLSRAGIHTDHLKKSWPSIMSNLADTLPVENEQSSIEILIGNDYYWDIITGEKIEISPGLYFVNSKFGWIITGRIANMGSEKQEIDESAMLLLTAKEIPELYCKSKLTCKDSENLEMEHFWKLETIGIHDPIEENDDDRALKMFSDDVKYEDGRYYVTWPWKSENPLLPDNFELAKCRLKCLTKKLSQDPAILKKYDEILQDQLQKGIIEKVDEHTTEGKIKHYVPHHAVITPQKATTKVRIVYDASAKMKKQKSLNECLYRGPVMLEDLCLLLIRMRMWKVAVVADIEKAFLQIGLQEHERDVTRFLWIKDISQPAIGDNIEVLRFTRVPFGVIASQFLLCATVLYHLNEVGTPTAKTMRDNIYVDNVMGGVSSPEEAVSFYKEGKLIFQKAAMNLREWASNCPEFNSMLPPDDRANSNIIKLLGLQWYLKDDELSINDSFKGADMPLTKRYVLKRIAGIFDPLGLVNPIIVQAKLFLQLLWKEGVEWDDKLSDGMSHRWMAIEDELNKIHTLRVPRFISYGGKVRITMLCFCDASELCYSTAVYLKIQYEEQAQVNLTFSKTRVTPKRKLSLPRLELLAVLIGIRCMNWVEKGLKSEVREKHLWTDSQCVLKWLQSTKPLSVFIENRTREIKETQDVTFHYVNTHENPADLLTRGKMFDDIKGSTLWWEGPAWLIDEESKWPTWEFPTITAEKLSEIESETRGPKTLHEMSCIVQDEEPTKLSNTTPFGINIDEYSSLKKLLRVTAWLLRFVNKARKVHSQKGELTASEISHAKRMWCSYIQKSEYPELLKAKTQKHKNIVAQLSLYEDEEGLIRCGGRLKHADLSQEAKFPILLPKKHRYTELVVQKCHQEIHHAGVSHTLARVRYEFWIPHGRAEVRRINMKCQICKRHEGGSYKVPVMPPLPEERVSTADPFTYTGLDYLGPLYIRGDEVKKVWICLFTCMVTRAVHLELVEDMTADQFMMCLRRFIARRGKPKQIISDNASQMKLVEKTLDKAWKENVVKNEDVISYMANEEIKWKFIPEYAPWMGGFYERLVQSVKRALRKTIGKSCLSYVQLETLLTEVEAVLNSRPLCYVGDDSDLGHVITPNHYLSMNQKSGFIEIEDVEDPDFIEKVNSVQQLLNLWKKGQNMLNNFWLCWRNDYLQGLRERYQKDIKCSRIESKDKTKLGDVVLIKDNTPRGSWKLGRICELIQSFDDAIRSAKVRTANGKILQRPLNMLYPIEVSCDMSENINVVPKSENAVNDNMAKKNEIIDVSRPMRQAAVDARRKIQEMIDF